MNCLVCNYDLGHQEKCPLCEGAWQRFGVLFSSLPFEEARLQVASWLGTLPTPSVLEIAAAEEGVRLRLWLPPGAGQGALDAWASMFQHQSRWKRLDEVRTPSNLTIQLLKARSPWPSFAATSGDAFLALAGWLKDRCQQEGGEAAVRFFVLLGADPETQQRIRALSAYSYGTEGGVGDSPNPWSLRLGLMRFLLVLGILIAGLSGGALGAGWAPPGLGVIGLLGGLAVSAAGGLGMLDWMRYRSVPKDVLERRASQPLLRVALVLQATSHQDLPLSTGPVDWVPISSAEEWPGVRAYAMPIPVGELAALTCPPETGEISGIIAADARQDVPTPPPSAAMRQAPFRIGVSAATGEDIGIDPDGHGMATGGSRTGKSSFVYRLLRQLIERGDDAPGIFLVDPHLSLADGFLSAVDQLPQDLRAKAIARLRVITPDQPELVPLNLLCVPEFSWAANAIVQVGRRIWDDYWGPRMQAALLGLFHLVHAWNAEHPDKPMGLIHTVFAAFNADWRHSILSLLRPDERIDALALDALLGQTVSKWENGWVTEVISPVLSKAMALNISPWLFASMHQGSFANIDQWIKERAWVVLRLPSGTMGSEAARLTASVVYNVFDAAFRRAAIQTPIPYYFVVDEAQEIGTGMRLESMLSEGAKFGARAFVLAQSLSMMRKIEGMEAVVQSMLANTSTQAFFSPDPDDADLVRAALSSSLRYGDMALDLPTLQAWLRARLEGRWQPPTVMRIEPLPRSNADTTTRIIREVIDSHPQDYLNPEGWREQAVQALECLVPPSARKMLSGVFNSMDTGDGSSVVDKVTKSNMPAEYWKKMGIAPPEEKD